MDRRKLVTAFAATALAVIGFGGVASASVPGWFHWFHGTKVSIPKCTEVAAKAVKSVTGEAPTTTILNSTNQEVRGHTANVMIFVTCTASPVDMCPGDPRADISILTFSTDKAAAADVNHQVDDAFGTPKEQIIDCGGNYHGVNE